LIVMPLTAVYWRLATPLSIPKTTLPNPNGYDDLVQAGKMLQNVTVVRDNFHWRDLRGLGKLLAYVLAVTLTHARSERWKRRREFRRRSSPNQ
jgi:hypothetical protein